MTEHTATEHTVEGSQPEHVFGTVKPKPMWKLDPRRTLTLGEITLLFTHMGIYVTPDLWAKLPRALQKQFQPPPA